MYGYVGPELAAPITEPHNLKDYWYTKTVHGQDDFRRVMPRDIFLKIRALIQLYQASSHEEAEIDPPWY